MEISGDENQDMFFALDHELRHCLEEKTVASVARNIDESTADAYAMLRHMQRNGVEDGFLTLLTRRRAEAFVLYGDLKHMTNAAIYKIDEIKSTIHFDTITLAEMAERAHDIAADVALSKETVKEIALIDKQVRAGLQRDDEAYFGSYLMEMGKVLREQNVSKGMFDFGLAILKPFMQPDGGHTLPHGMVKDDWRSICDALQEKERRLKGTNTPARAQKAGLACK